MKKNIFSRKGLFLVLSSPSGAGKTTISRKLVSEVKNLTLSISVTTREKRRGEVEGRDYYFVDKKRFISMKNKGKFLEHAKVFGHHYGTLKSLTTKKLSAGRDVVFDIDWQGAQQLRKKLREDIVSVFILPPSFRVLKKRLVNRNQDSEPVLRKRMSLFSREVSHWAEYDYVVINDNLRDCINTIRLILESSRMQRNRQKNINSFVKGLRGKN